ncbi:MAG: hypothetical protein A2Y73_04105 [Chloroflexi bacterium RBG_13_56_8]|nr:MAG: hypothetical protein A2Y73_04105 [Chloroflexi bacterium RBG_13_56_8]
MARAKAVLGKLWQAIRSGVREYLVIVRGRSEGAGLARLAEISQGGPLNWLGLAVRALSVLATAYLGLYAQRFPFVTAEVWEGESLSIPTPAVYLSLLIVSFAWAYLLVGAAAVGFGAYVLVAVYGAYYGLVAGLALGGTVWFALIPIWLLLLGGWVASSSPGHWRLPLLLLLSLVVSWLTRNALGLKNLLPGTLGNFILAACYFALIANPWALKPRAFRPVPAFFISLLLYGVFYALNLRRAETSQVFANVFLSVHGLWGIVALYWYWLGLDLFNGAQDMAEWVVQSVRGWVSRRRFFVLVLALWVLWGVVTYILSYGPPWIVVRLLAGQGWGERLLRNLLAFELPFSLAWTLNYHLYLTLGFVAIVLVLGILRRLSSERLLGLLGLWVAGFFAIWGYFGLFFVFGGGDFDTSFGFWPLLIFSGGMFWEILKTSPRFASESRPRSLFFLGFLLLLAGIATLELAAQYGPFQQELSLNSYLGIVYLGVPYLLYTALYRSRRYAPIPSGHLLLLFALGMLSAIPCLVVGRLFFAPALWIVAVLAAMWRRGRWDDPWDGAIYTLAVALGFSVYYTHPIFIPIPAFTSWMAQLVQIQAQYGGLRIWPWQAEWWWILGGSAVSALAVGVLLNRARQHWLFVALAFLVGMAIVGSTEWLGLGVI